MRWQASHRLGKYMKESLWVVPALALLAGGFLAIIDVAFVEGHINLPHSWQYSAGTASTVLAAVVSAMVGLTGIVVAVAVLIIQMATGTLSPRYMRIWFRDPLQKAVLAGFLGTLAFAYALLRNIDGGGQVPNLGVSLAGVSLAVSMILFLYYIDHFAHLLRPVGLSAYVSGAGAKVIRSFWGGLEAAGIVAVGDRAREGSSAEEQSALAVRSTRAGVVQAMDQPGLLGLATGHHCRFAVRCTIGDFVLQGDPLLEVYGTETPPSEDAIRRRFALGTERAFEQDTAFALRIVVDIAIRALSPAVNDPTTGVQLLDHIEGLLLLIGERELADRYELRDDGGRSRVVFRSRTWEDYLTLGVTEILEYGSTSTQVTRRLRALLERLLESVHPANRQAVRAQLARLDAALEADVPDGVRREFASRADRQGLGGPGRSTDER
ncbi:MAG: DUF2254 domain-containing protein [Solirubrobacterales bacterium]